jgi:hypothetical protein
MAKMLTVADDINVQIQTPGGYSVEAVPMPIPGGAPAGAEARIVWDNNGGGSATTWADVMAQLTAQGMAIYVAPSETDYVIPAGVYDLRDATFTSAVFALPFIQLEDAAQLQNCRGISDVVLYDNNNALPGLTFPDALASRPIVFTIDGQSGEAAFVKAGMSVASFSLPTGEATPAFNLRNGAAMAISGSGAIASLASSGLLVIITDNELGGSQLPDGWLVGDAASQLGYYTDGTQQNPLPDISATFLGSVALLPFATVGGAGALRPLSPPAGNLFCDTSNPQAPSQVSWDAFLGKWNTLAYADSNLFPNRADSSVNNAQVENLHSPIATLRTQSGGNVAGGFNGGGTGNKAILGTGQGSAWSFGALTSISFTWKDVQPSNPGPGPYLNLLISLSGTTAGPYVIGVIDPSLPASLHNGTTVLNADGSFTTTWNAATDAMPIVQGLLVPPNPPGGPGFVPPSFDDSPPVPPPLPGGWLHYSYTLAAIAAAYPSAQFLDGDTGDGGMPKSPNVVRYLAVIVGDSNNQLARTFEISSVQLNGAAC